MNTRSFKRDLNNAANGRKELTKANAKIRLA